LGPEGLDAEGSENPRRRNHNRYRPGFGQESLVYTDPIVGPCKFK
jgi:hypothetical protein